jgi:hypothetical protein
VMWLCEHGIMPLYTPLGGCLSQYDRVDPAHTQAARLRWRTSHHTTTNYCLVGGDGRGLER